MRLLDYLRLGFSGIKAHKKRAFTVGIITGLLLSVIASGVFILQGLENTALQKMLQPTNGKLMIMTSVEKYACGENCNLENESIKIKQNIEKYGGNVIDVKIAQTEFGVFYKIDDSFLNSIHRSNVGNEVAVVATTLKMAANLANIKLPEQDADISEKLKIINDVRTKTLRKTITSSGGKKYYIAEILPSEVYASDLSFMNTRSGSLLDPILSQINTGLSQNFVIKEAEPKPQNENTSAAERVLGFIQAEDISSEKMGIVFAEFTSLEKAYNYYKDDINYCKKLNHFFGSCSENYKYHVASAFSDPLSTYDNFKNIWLVVKIIALGLGVVAAIITIITHIRLIGADTKIISLYQAMGANKHQLRLIYIIYLTFLNILAAIFALMLGLILATLLSLSIGSDFERLFMLGFGVESGGICLVGWNNLVLMIIGSSPLLAVFSVLLGNGNFKTKELAQKLK